jgi:DNA-binding NarL/FixJ family response regulator
VIRVVIADDQPLVRAGLRTLLESATDIEVVAEAVDGLDAVDVARRARPDVMLMDIRMPALDGIEATRRIVAAPDLGGVSIVILTTFEVDEYIAQALRAGASGFLLKDAEPEEILRAVRVVAAGEALLAPRITRRLLTRFTATPPAPADAVAQLDRLTPRELEILRHVGQGLSNEEVAAALVISHATVKTHVSHILSKLGARDRVQLVVLAFQAGLAGDAPTI